MPSFIELYDKNSGTRITYKKYLVTLYMVFLGYGFAIIMTLAGKALGLTSISYRVTLVISATVLVYTGGTILITFLNKNMNELYGEVLFYSHYLLFILMYCIWIYHLNELRWMGITCSLIAVSFVIFITDRKKSLVMSMGTLTCQLLVTIWAVRYAGQKGDLTGELFFIFCFMPVFLFLSYVAQQLDLRNKEIEKAHLDLEQANMDLLVINRTLHEANRVDAMEREIASYLQAAVLPKGPIVAPGWDIAFSYRPRSGISGDFYDFYFDGDTLAGMCLYDVSGHGISAALVTMLAKPVLYRCFRNHADETLSSVVRAANDEIALELEHADIFITGIMLRMVNGKIEYVNTGHPDMLLRRHRTGDTVAVGEKLGNFKGKPIGIFRSDSVMKTVRFSLSEGDCLLCFTDCLLESSDTMGSAYGRDRILASFKNAPEGTAREMLDYMLGEFYSTVEEKYIKDDLTVVLVKKT